MDDNTRDLAQEAMLMDIIADGQNAVRSFLNDTDEQVEQELRLEDLGYDIDEFGNPMHMEEVDREDGSGDRKSTRLNSSHHTKSRMPSSA